MTPAEVYRLAVGAGLGHEASITATAIAWAESGLNPTAVGDSALVDDTWGPSYGLWQVRSLHEHHGTGKERDGVRLPEPAFNARSMASISRYGANWTPWSVFKNGKYRQHLDAVKAAVKETTVETWHPRARDASANRSGGAFIGVAPKIVLHTVEGRGRYSYNPSSYYGNPYWPHATIDGEGIHQHLPIDVYGFALANAAGGAETNRANAIQCEILWFSAEIEDLPDDVMAHVADWVDWVAEQTGTPLEFTEFRGDGSYGENAPQRFGAREWLDFSGICGHQHVPENDHWDPGAFPVDRLRALLGNAPPPDPIPVPVPQEEDDTMRLIGVTNNRGIFLTSSSLQASGKA
ncbi:MAG: hypothetical protein LC798_19625, partial [Chloroflexi bacterium]|nr:hypothetical protein [Chloroflexota bacterium]